jgi:hypothetical protein
MSVPMEQLFLKHFRLLPEHLQIEALHYIQFLLTVKCQQIGTNELAPETDKPTFVDFHFTESGQTYSRSEIYSDDGR